MPDNKERLIQTIRDSVIGGDQAVETPFGLRRVTYADYTASGRCLSFIEDFMRHEVMPFYANTHTEASITGEQTTRFREEARAIIKKALRASDEDCLIFCGSGATGAITKLIGILNLCIPSDLNSRYELDSHIPPEERPVVFIGPYEHHSNELPWRESIADVIMIDEDSDGRVCQTMLRQKLEQYQDRPLKIGSFSAASNVTGIGSDTKGITALLHEFGALSFWDFAAAGPYVEVEMNIPEPSDDPEKYPPGCFDKDAIFLSPHKFIGGPGSPGILVVKRKLLTNSVPSDPGGGTVSYVTATSHDYNPDPEVREEGGTPNILGCIRAGLVFQLKEAVGEEIIYAREREYVQRAIKYWSQNPNIQILGNKDAWRLSIVSFVIKHGNKFLHHNFVVALLSDLFGIQVRGGCSCAGPYGHRLLNIDITRSEAYEREVLLGCEGIKPGWVRLNFNYFISEEVFDFLLKAVDLIAREGHRLLSAYDFNPAEGHWSHRERKEHSGLSLHDIHYESGRLSYRSRHHTEPEFALATYIEEAEQILQAYEPQSLIETKPGIELSENFETLRWFPLPGQG